MTTPGYGFVKCAACGYEAWGPSGEPPPIHACHPPRAMPETQTRADPMVYAHLSAEASVSKTAYHIEDKQAQPKATCHAVNDKQIGGDHYKHDAIQVWDFVAANNIPYFEATAIKYLCRWRREPSKEKGLQSLQKAIHFIEKLISVESAKQ